ncbi:MAG: DUF6175 family protein [Tannerella sp.]|jgi:hypothetical protein|nr:DUF6175 family protein [Tannerella sp.]
MDTIRLIIFFMLAGVMSLPRVYAQDMQQAEQTQISFQPGSGINTIQPRIMVIPYTKEGEDIRTILEDDVNKRIVLTRIREAFDRRGFTTVDFTARLKSAMGNAVFMGANKSDLKAQIIQMSGADIYVEAEMDFNRGQYTNNLRLILQAYESTSGNSLANIVGESKLFSNDAGTLGTKALESCIEEFLNTMNMKFTDIVNNGKTVLVTIGFDKNSNYDLSSSVGTEGLQLFDAIESWMSENSYRNYYHMQGATDTEMLFDDVRIPLRDPATNSNYTLNRFALIFYQYLRSLGLDVKRDVRGNTLFVTIQ